MRKHSGLRQSCGDKKKSRRRFITSKEKIQGQLCIFKPVNQELTEECSSDSFATKLSAFSYWLENIYNNKRKEFYKMMRAETINNPKIQESPIIRTEYNGVQVTITFDETAEGEGKNVKRVIMDMLTRAYERSITE
jgi:hypothetical protein